MAIQDFITDTAGQVEVNPRILKLICDDTLATITTAGYLNPQISQGKTVLPTDLVLANFANFECGQFRPTFSNGICTLKACTPNATTPTVINDIAVFRDVYGNLVDAAAVTAAAGNLQAGYDAVSGVVISYPSTTASGTLRLKAINNSGNTATTISNAAMGQASVISIPDPGAATANFVLDAGTATVVNITNLKYGATPVAQVDPASCTITAAAGAANTATVTIQLKDGSGTNMARSIRFKVYSSSAADGLTLQSAATTGYSVASGGLSLANGTAVTTQIEAMSSVTGGCVLSLLDTGKLTSYLVLSLPSGNKISAQLSTGSYG